MSKRSIMTTIIIPVLLISVLVIVLVNNQQEFPGELVFAQDKVNFGTIPEWEGTVTRSVTAKNAGKNSGRVWLCKNYRTKTDSVQRGRNVRSCA